MIIRIIKREKLFKFTDLFIIVFGDNMEYSRKSGVLIHITSFPSEYGVGDLGYPAKLIIDYLKNAHQKLIQILPVGPTEPFFDNSPYSSISAFAINPIFISLEKLVDIGLIKNEDITQFKIKESNFVDYNRVIENKFKAFRSAFKNFKETDEFYQFCDENTYFLDDYSLFVALKGKFNGKTWQEWPEEFRNREKNALLLAKESLSEEIRFIKFLQFIAYKQFLEFKDYANNNGIKIIGDIPIYVDLNSADAWANRHLFDLDENGYPVKVAGVPPDYFNEDGQLWGNPVYNWNAHKETNFEWWIKRFNRLLKITDIIRLDHFRGFVAYYAIERGMPNARIGEWINVPVYDFFDTVKSNLKDMSFIAEDLGLITEDVVEVIKHYKIPNMRVLMFAFDGSPTNLYLPHNYENPTVVYTGTHDHNTCKGWLKFEVPDSSKAYLKSYLGHEPSIDTIHKDLMRLALSSVAYFSIIPIQDVLGLDETSRMNSPGVAHNNWRFRLKTSDLNDEDFAFLKELTDTYGR